MLMDQNKTKVKKIYMLRTVSTWFLCSYILNKHPASAGPQRSGHWAPHAAPEGSEAESPRSTREALWEQGFPLSPAFSPAHPRAQRHTPALRRDGPVARHPSPPRRSGERRHRSRWRIAPPRSSPALRHRCWARSGQPRWEEDGVPLLRMERPRLVSALLCLQAWLASEM